MKSTYICFLKEKTFKYTEKLKRRKTINHAHVYFRLTLSGKTEQRAVSRCRDVLGGGHSGPKEQKKRQRSVERHGLGGNEKGAVGLL